MKTPQIIRTIGLISALFLSLLTQMSCTGYAGHDAALLEGFSGAVDVITGDHSGGLQRVENAGESLNY